MSLKQNSAIQIDREAIDVAAMYAVNAAREMEEMRNEIAKHAQYLTNEENIAGKEAEEFVAAVTSVSTSIGIVTQRMDSIAKAFSKLNAIYNNQASVAKRTFSEARESMQRITMAIKSQNGK